MSKLSKSDIRAITMLVAAGEPLKTIATEWGVNDMTVRYHAKKAGVLTPVGRGNHRRKPVAA